MNSQHFLVMNLLRVPPLLLHSTHTVPVTSQILINNHLLFFCKEIYWFIISGRLLFQNSQTQKQFRQVLNEPALKYHDDQHHQHYDDEAAADTDYGCACGGDDDDYVAYSDDYDDNIDAVADDDADDDICGEYDDDHVDDHHGYDKHCYDVDDWHDHHYYCYAKTC